MPFNFAGFVLKLLGLRDPQLPDLTGAQLRYHDPSRRWFFCRDGEMVVKGGAYHTRADAKAALKHSGRFDIDGRDFVFRTVPDRHV